METRVQLPEGGCRAGTLLSCSLAYQGASHVHLWVFGSKEGWQERASGSLPQPQMKPALKVLQVSFLAELQLWAHDLPKEGQSLFLQYLRRGALPVLPINKFRCTKEPSPSEVASFWKSVGTVSSACQCVTVITVPTFDYQQAYIHHWPEWTQLRYLNIINLKSRQGIAKSILTVTFKTTF